MDSPHVFSLYGAQHSSASWGFGSTNLTSLSHFSTALLVSLLPTLCSLDSVVHPENDTLI